MNDMDDKNNMNDINDIKDISGLNFLPESLFYLEKSIASGIFKGVYYAWEVLPRIRVFLLELSEKLTADYERVEEDVWIGRGTTVERTALIKGPAIIGCGCEIRHSAYIRGNVIIGNNVVVGNSTEIKNAILFDKVQVPHFNYVGDSILGYKSHLGAGVILSNVKSTDGNVKVRTEMGFLDTGLRKFGALIGDNVEVGCNCVLNPGTVVGRESVIYPMTSVRGNVPANSIMKNDGRVIKKR